MTIKSDHDLIQQVLDGSISHEGFKAFQMRLRNEPELLGLYREYALLHHTLCEEFEGHQIVRMACPKPRRSYRAPAIAVGFAAAAAVVLLATQLNRPARPSRTAPPAIAQAEVAFSDDAVWNIKGDHFATGQTAKLERGAILHLQQGQARLTLGGGAAAVIDGNTEAAIVLNDVYEADLNTYRSGQVRYRLNDLSEGAHTLELKAWDVHNNSSVRSIDFVVAPSAELALEHVLNYPNPFTTRTEFYFEHNRPCGELDVRLQVFTVAGRLVKTLARRLQCEGFRSEPLAWDGLDDQGDKLGRGVYVYRLSISNDAGESADKIEKLVILR